MPNPFLAPDTLEQAGLPTESLRVTNPLVSDESVLRTSLRPGLLQAIAYNESHRRTGVSAVRDRPRLPARRRASCRTSTRRWRWSSPARRRPTPSPSGESWPTPSASARASTSAGPGRPASDSVGDAAGRTRAARWRRRGPPGSARRVRRDRTSGDPRARPRSTARPRAEADPVEADQPVPVERSRPRVRRCPRRRRPSGSTRRSGRAPASCSSTSTLFDVYRGDRVADGTRSLAYRLRLQAPDRNLTDADIAEVRRGVEAAATKLGADLRS